MKAGSLTGTSIGYMLDDYEYDKEKGVWILKQIDLWSCPWSPSRPTTRPGSPM